ncbi:sulfite exporter TauE/SafE family protein [Staphylococcus pseudoxylosus]|uniref:sulfite exporter TauE/SafE family protein n=1 Tax=Staphylococcus pseudoxylosus TaxID=2282419 RepID=UPI002DBEEDB6|nr:sulfite exporter TauE/SafE family protein [Staphylococcus pseudoxylosus]MEB6035916.1 sulfite exporter TauE/SafE family protein [Staphylococcus pseudoxylosus]MEB6045209.1 sulfite exporter TauE/SafE family protein [Staphylococcus pseudoxylosus]MEB7763011.1 sulfite exporter TauE/SafE family protein [Staphylococcus pseudoxylosus]MEB8008087.1 sulfite exporter TauE/SafE family protein [Staphylococcus pseudoxylosus]
MLIVLTMLLLGMVLGFVGAGGAGVIIAVLTVFFNVPIHYAIGTSLIGLVSTSLFGSLSHYREKNIDIKIAFLLGIPGGIGALIASFVVEHIPQSDLNYMTASALFVSGLTLWIKLSIKTKSNEKNVYSKSSFLLSIIIGFVLGMLSGFFGIGSSAFIQLTLLLVIGLSVQLSVGTTMLVMFPISLIGGIGYIINGNVDFLLLVKVVFGTSIGSYIGAKFTNKLNPIVLKISMVSVPIIGGLILITN